MGCASFLYQRPLPVNIARRSPMSGISRLALWLRRQHLFLEVEGDLWLFDTGAPGSFGSVSPLTLAGEEFQLDGTFLGLDPGSLARFVGVDCVGLLGADVLGRFDVLLDVPNASATISTDRLDFAGSTVPLDDFMGIPIVSVRIRDTDYPMFLDTGAQVSYFQHDSLRSFPAAGSATDFYPGIGQFETETHALDVTLGGEKFKLRCGTLPQALDVTLSLAGVAGIVGNELIVGRSVGYFPRRGLLVL